MLENESLILDLLEWVAKHPRSYKDVMDAWRTSCPRLPIWEDACDHGLLVREQLENGDVLIHLTASGRQMLMTERGILSELTEAGEKKNDAARI